MEDFNMTEPVESAINDYDAFQDGLEYLEKDAHAKNITLDEWNELVQLVSKTRANLKRMNEMMSEIAPMVDLKFKATDAAAVTKISISPSNTGIDGKYTVTLERGGESSLTADVDLPLEAFKISSVTVTGHKLNFYFTDTSIAPLEVDLSDLEFPDPVEDTDAVPKKFVDDKLKGKLDKIVLQNMHVGAIPVVSSDGSVSAREVTNFSSSDTIPLRDGSGNFYVGTPTFNSHAATKKYVDDSLKNTVPLHPDKYDNSTFEGLLYARIGEKVVSKKMSSSMNTGSEGAIVMRNADRTILVPDPDLDTQAANKSYVDKKVNEVAGSVYRFKGSVKNFEELESLEQVEANDVYNVINETTLEDNTVYPKGTNFAYTIDGTWDALGGEIDLASLEDRFNEKVSKKLDKMYEPDAVIGVLPLVDAQGVQKTIVADYESVPNSIPVRNESGNFEVSNPIASNEVANKGYVDNNTVPKITTTSGFERVYGIGTDGSQKVFSASINPAGAGTLVRFYGNGKIRAEDGKEKTEVVNYRQLKSNAIDPVADHEKRIELLEGTLIDSVDDNKSAYEKVVPSNSGNVAFLNSVSGNTKFGYNLLNIVATQHHLDSDWSVPYLWTASYSATDNSITVTDTSNNARIVAYTGEAFVKAFNIYEAGDYVLTYKTTGEYHKNSWRLIASAASPEETSTVFICNTGDGSGYFTVTEEMLAFLRTYNSSYPLSFYMYGEVGDVFSEIQITKGQTKKPYEPFNNAHPNIKPTAVKRTGCNLIDVESINHSAGSSDVKYPHLWNAKYDKDTNSITSFNTNVRIICYSMEAFTKAFKIDKPGDYVLSYITTGSYGSDWRFYAGGRQLVICNKGDGSGYFTITEEHFKAIQQSFDEGSNVSFYIYGAIGDTYSKIQINRGTEKLPYKPYNNLFVNYNIPKDVQNLPNYGRAFTRIDFECKKFVDASYLIAFTGDEAFEYEVYTPIENVSYPCVVIKAENSSFPAGNKTVADYISTDSVCENPYGSGTMQCGVNGTSKFRWVNILATMGLTQGWADPQNPTDEEKATAVESFKNFLKKRASVANPVRVVYHTASFTETDISEHLTDYDDYKELDVEPGGTIVIENEHKYDVPSSIAYHVRRE